MITENLPPKNSANSRDKDNDDFLISCNKILDRHAPLRKKYVTGNHSSFMNKNLSKAIMLRTKLRKIFLKSITEKNIKVDALSKEICV